MNSAVTYASSSDDDALHTVASLPNSTRPPYRHIRWPAALVANYLTKEDMFEIGREIQEEIVLSTLFILYLFASFAACSQWARPVMLIVFAAAWKTVRFSHPEKH